MASQQTRRSLLTLAQKRFAYAHSKYLAEQEVLRAVKRGLAAVIVNPAAVIGPGDHYLISGSHDRRNGAAPSAGCAPRAACAWSTSTQSWTDTWRRPNAVGPANATSSAART